MKKIILLATLFLMIFSFGCNKDFDTLNVDPKRPTDVSPDFLFAGAQRSMSDILANSNVNQNIFRLISQQWTQTTYFDETNYDLGTRQIPQNFWNSIYINVIKSLEECKAQIPTQDKTFVPTEVQKNQIACADIMLAYAYSVLVTTYGNIPYSKAIDIENVYPVYDGQKEIFASLISRLDADIAALDSKNAAFGGNDLLLGGDISSWKTFANSLKLRLGVMLADVDPALAKTTVSSAATGVIKSNDENISFHYLASPPNTNPIWVDLIQSNRKDFIAADTFINLMDAWKDPRMSSYFTLDNKGSYSGGIVGVGNSYSTFSKPGSKITAQNLECVFIDFSEVSFLLAESVERGLITGTAADHYNTAIKASVEYWGGTSSQADAYLAQPAIAYATAKGDWKQKIGIQKWLALYNRGFESWTEIRRLDTPKLNAPAEANSDFPVRYTYPTQEKNLNTNNYNRAAADIGGDAVTTKLYWDKF